MTKVTIDRELLERANSLLCSYSSTLTDRAVTRRAISEICAILAAPRQPEGEWLEVVAYQSLDATRGGGWMAHKHALPQSHIDQGALQEPLCRLSDAQRAIAELREEISNLHTTMMAAAVEIQEHWQSHCDEDGYGPANLMHRLERGIASQYGYTAQTLVQIEAERDTMRQQLAELREECERLRMQLAACGVVALANTPESASEARQMHQDYMSASCSDVAGAVDREMTLRQQLAERDAQIASMRAEVTPFIETHWMPVARQRDKLAHLCKCALGYDISSALRTQIDAALAELKP